MKLWVYRFPWFAKYPALASTPAQPSRQQGIPLFATGFAALRFIYWASYQGGKFGWGNDVKETDYASSADMDRYMMSLLDLG